MTSNASAAEQSTSKDKSMDDLPPEIMLMILVDWGGSLTIRDMCALRCASRNQLNNVLAAMSTRFDRHAKASWSADNWMRDKYEPILEYFGIPAGTRLVKGVAWLCLVGNHQLPGPFLDIAGLKEPRSVAEATVIVICRSLQSTGFPIRAVRHDNWTFLHRLVCLSENILMWASVSPIQVFEGAVKAASKVPWAIESPFFYAGLLIGRTIFAQKFGPFAPFEPDPSFFQSSAKLIRKTGLIKTFDQLRDLKLAIDFAVKLPAKSMDLLGQVLSMPPKPTVWWFAERHGAPPPGTAALSRRESNKLSILWSKEWDSIELVKISVGQ